MSFSFADIQTNILLIAIYNADAREGVDKLC
jgi:hypothetical protein